MSGRRFHIITFGCQMNVHDSQWLAGELTALGLEESPLAGAQLVVLNTCSVREKPEQKVMSAIGRVLEATSGQAVLAITGCVAQQLGRVFFTRYPQVRLLAGADGMAAAPRALLRILDEPDLRLDLLDFSPIYLERSHLATPPAEPCASVNIMQGCDNFCAYCIVPYTRGRQKSRGAEAVLQECRAGIAAGAREITLLGQNVNAYGRDGGSAGEHFGALLHAVAALPGLARLRYVSAHPRDMSQEDVDDFARLPVLCPRLHLPVQSGSSRVLTRMGRRYSREQYLDLVRRLRLARPDLALSTDIIVGFPGESEEDFEDTLSLMRQCGFISSFSFCYSDRPGTRASRMDGKIDPATGRERLGRLQALQEELSRAWLDARVGGCCEVLLERPSPRQSGEAVSWQGRDPYGAIVHVAMPPGRHAGRLLRVRVGRAARHSLMAEPA